MENGYGVYMEDIFENEMEWNGFGGVQLIHHKTKFSPNSSFGHKQDKMHQLPGYGITKEAFMKWRIRGEWIWSGYGGNI